MLSKEYGWKKIKLIPIENQEQHYEIEKINFKTFKKQIILMEEEVWGEDSDPDIEEMPLWNSYMIKSEDYILAYILMSKRYFVEGHLNCERKKYEAQNCQVAVDIEDFVVLNMRKAAPFIPQIIDLIEKSLNDLNPDFIVCNPNSLSKPFIKRLKKFGYPIKYYSYPSYNAEGYQKMKDGDN